MRKDWKDLLAELDRQGFRARSIKNGWQFIPPNPDAHIVVIHKTPSDWRNFHNTISDLRKSGFVWKGH